MNIQAVLLSEYATVHASGHFSVINAFNRLRGPGPRWGVPAMYLTVVIEAHPSQAGTQHEIEIRLIDAHREPILPESFRGAFSFGGEESVLPGLPLRNITNAGLFGIQFVKPGPYAFEILIDGTYSGATTLFVEKVDAEGR
jgi:hypothetical protein